MGRPRKHPEGTTAVERERASIAALVASGGAKRTFRLSARSVESLAVIRSRKVDKDDTALIERLIEAERERG